MKERHPLVFVGREVVWTHSERDEVSHQPRGRDTRCDDHHSPDDEEFAALQFGAGFQSLKKDVNTEDEDQHYEDDGNRQMVPSEIRAADMEIVIGGSEALAYHRSHTDKDTSQCESGMSKMGSLQKILRVRRGRRCHRKRLSISSLIAQVATFIVK